MHFHTKLLIAFACFFLLAVTLLLYLSTSSEKTLAQKMDSDLEDVIRTVHFSTHKLSAEKSSTRETLNRFVEEAARNKNVREISVLNHNQEVVASSNPKKIGRPHGPLRNEIVVNEELGTHDESGPKRRYNVTIPIERENEVVGLVQTSIVVTDYGEFLRRLYFRNLYIAAAVLLSLFAASYFVIYRLSKPLQTLTAAAERVGQGDLSLRLSSTRGDEVGRLTTSFNRMIEKLSEHQHLEEKYRVNERTAVLSETAAALAHEVRNPLNLLNLTADHLAHQLGNADPELVTNFKAQVRQLNQMVTEFLNFGRPARARKVSFAVADLFSQAELLVKQRSVEKRLELSAHAEASLTLFGDPDQMRLVLLNLLLNAVEVCPPGARIRFEASVSGPQVLMVVEDNGPGILPENRERIFEPYFSTRPDGSGLGLALAKRIVEEHGGQIKAVDAKPGARFEILLPKEA